jgi:hypothetical protein
MAFLERHLSAMERHFGSRVSWRGVEIGPCLFGTRLQTADDGAGFGVQRSVQTLRVRAGLLGTWKRDDPITIDGKPYKLRELLDDPQTVDGAWDLVSVGRA